MFFTEKTKESSLNRLKNASPEAVTILADFLMDGILNGEMPEEHKIGVRIMQAHRQLKALLEDNFDKFAQPIPPTEEGNALCKELYPVRKAYFEYLQLVKANLESFLKSNPAPVISEEFLKEQEKILERKS